MELWRLVLIIGLSWFLLGALSTIIPQCSRRMREKLIAANRRNTDRAVDQYAKRREYSPLQVHHHLGTSRTSDSDHLGRTYVMLVLSGLWSYLILWSLYREKPPGTTPSSGGR
mgnify:CR=1 FL=1